MIRLPPDCEQTIIEAKQNTHRRKILMLSEQTLSILNALKLFGMARGFSERLSHPKTADLSHEEFLGLLVQDEKTYRENLRLKRLLKNAKLKQPAALEDIDYKHPRGLNKQLILELCSAQWITHHRNVLLTGPTGVGQKLHRLRARQSRCPLRLQRPLSSSAKTLRNPAAS
jgi:DNA replication protein DnaC